MSNVNSILDKNRRTLTVNGTEYVIRIPGAMQFLRALGAGALNISDPDGASGGATGAEVRQLEIAEAVLRLVMVSPKLGDVTDPESDTISLDDLGPDADVLLAEVDKIVGGDVEGFRQSSEAATG